MNRYIVELLDYTDRAVVSSYIEEYLNWAEHKGFELMFINSIQRQALCFFKRREIVDIDKNFRPSQAEFTKWRNNK